jgi:hypothetical protein
MGDVTIDSGITDAHAEKAAIEEALRSVLENVEGLWRVDIDTRAVHIEADDWWTITVHGESGFSWTLFLDSPDKQTPEFIRKELDRAIRGQAREE